MSILSNRQHLLMFLCLQGFILILCIMFFLTNLRPYQSDLVKVTPNIETPVAVGQHQHGSSRWLTEDEMDKYFDNYTLDPHDRAVRFYIDHAKDDLKKAKENEQHAEKIVSRQDSDMKANSRSAPEPESGQKSESELKTDSEPNLESGSRPNPESNPELNPELATNTNPSRDVSKKSDAPAFSIPSGGVVLGMKKEDGKEKIYYVGNDTHTLTIGATRSGKTRSVVLQSICTLALAGESLVISDPKAELYHYSAGFLERLGYEVVALDFKTPEKSSHYNLLQPIIDAAKDGNLERAEMLAWDMTNILVGKETGNSEKIWHNGEMSVIAATILCVVCDNLKRYEYQNLTNVYWFMAEMWCDRKVA